MSIRRLRAWLHCDWLSRSKSDALTNRKFNSDKDVNKENAVWAPPIRDFMVCDFRVLFEWTGEENCGKEATRFYICGNSHKMRCEDHPFEGYGAFREVSREEFEAFQVIQE
jgi:hypothetical protein